MEDCGSDLIGLFEIEGYQNLNLWNISIRNTRTDALAKANPQDAIFFFGFRNRIGHVTFTSLTSENNIHGERPLLRIGNEMDSLKIVNSLIQNETIEAGANLLQVSLAKKVEFEDLTVRNVKQVGDGQASWIMNFWKDKL